MTRDSWGVSFERWESARVLDVQNMRRYVCTVCSYCAKFEVTETRPACRQVEWTWRLQPGQVLCVECQQFAGRGRRGQCAGDGVYRRETDWKAVSVDRCHGKWTMVSRHVTPCQCDPRDSNSFVFV